MKREKGSLTIEASLTLFLFLFVFLFFISFARYSAVQTKVKHCLNQTAISMSARNFQLSQISNVLKKGGLDIGKISNIITKFNANSVIPINEISPYTATAKDIQDMSTALWSTEDLEKEIIRFFAYYYIDLSFAESDKMSYKDIKKKLEEAGLKDFEILDTPADYDKEEEKGKVRTNVFIQGKDFTIRVKYKINTGWSINKVLGFDEFEFEDSVAATLLK